MIQERKSNNYKLSISIWSFGAWMNIFFPTYLGEMSAAQQLTFLEAQSFREGQSPGKPPFTSSSASYGFEQSPLPVSGKHRVRKPPACHGHQSRSTTPGACLLDSMH